MAITAPLDQDLAGSHENVPGPAEGITAHELGARLASGPRAATVLDLVVPTDRFEVHEWIPGSLVVQRATLLDDPGVIPGTGLIVLTSDDGTEACAAAAELTVVTDRPVRTLTGGTRAWVAARLLTSEGAIRRTLTSDGTTPPRAGSLQ